MQAALDRLKVAWGARLPKAFYLTEEDWSAFTSKPRRTVVSDWGNNPVKRRRDPGFKGIPVRPSTSKESRLYDNKSMGRAI